MQAAGLAYRLGREDEKPAEWLEKAVALSPEEGPARRIELRELIEEWMPKHQEHRRTAEDLWLKGEVPLHLVANSLNIPLSILLMDLPERNSRAQDGRRRTIIPVTSGAHRAVTLQSGWIVGFDITSLMVLSYLGLLKEAFGSFRRAVIAPDTMVVFLSERNQVRFHQPSLVKKAEEIRHLIDRGRLRVAEALPDCPRGLAEEVGRDLAQLLEASRRNQGRVVRPYPIHKPKSYMNEEANLGEYVDLILSTVELGRLLYENGSVDSTTHERASRYLRLQDRGTEVRAISATLEGPIYLDDLALTYLQGAGLLSVLEDSARDFRIHPSVKEEQLALIESERERQRLEGNLEKIRVTLRDALQCGQVEFLRRHGSTEEEEKFFQIAPTISEFLQDSGSCDAVAIDDRFLQRSEKLIDRSGEERWVIGVFDILRHLEAQGIITCDQRHSMLHKLRQAGFAFVPVEPNELLSYMRAALRDGAGIIESVELRTLRQTLARIRGLEMLNPAEAPFLGQLEVASIMAIRQIWADEAIPGERAVWITDWIWNHVSPSVWSWMRRSRDQRDETGQAFVQHLALLLMPIPIQRERLDAFLDWVQEDVLAPLLPVNSRLVDQLAQRIGQQIETWSVKLEEEDTSGAVG